MTSSSVRIWRMVLRIPRSVAVIEALVLVVIALLVVVEILIVVLVVISEGVQEFSLEELDVDEVSRSAARVELPCSDRDPTIRVEIEHQIFAYIRLQYEPPVQDLVVPLLSRPRNGRRHVHSRLLAAT
jgi:hypothetical protein